MSADSKAEQKSSGAGWVDALSKRWTEKAAERPDEAKTFQYCAEELRQAAVVALFVRDEGSLQNKADSFEALHLTYLQWVRETFPEETVSEQLEHLKEEFKEMSGNPVKGEEYADVLMLLLCVAHGNGIDIMAEFRGKFAVNLSRDWEKTERGFRHKPEPLTEADILIAIATAEGTIAQAAQQIMAGDKYDGLRAMKWLEQHNRVFRKILDECHGGPVDDETIELANKLAGEPV